MKHIEEIFRKHNHPDTHRPWLIIGKGPSFNYIRTIDIGKYNTLALNHAAIEVDTGYAHAIDLDVIIDIGEKLLERHTPVIMPLYPHINFRPSKQSLNKLIDQIELLNKLDKAGLLYWYNTSSSKNVDNNYPVVPVQFFSADAAVALLAFNGVKTIYTAGVDGGDTYAEKFSSLTETTLLANGRSSFSDQFRAFIKTRRKTGVRILPLIQPETVAVYFGSQKEQMLAVRVLEYSIKRHTALEVNVYALFDNDIIIPLPRDPDNQPRTPFSFQRFIIPELNGHTGKAIYIDSDMQVFADIAHLWNRDFNGNQVLSAYEVNASSRIPQYSVMLIDCESLGWEISAIVNELDTGKIDYRGLVHEMRLAKCSATIEPEWNSLERFEEHKTKLLHYTDMPSQPWLSLDNPLSPIWVAELIQAVHDDFICLEELLDQVIAGYVRPSLYAQVAKKQHDPNLTAIAKLKKLDRDFIKPYEKRAQRPIRIAAKIRKHLLHKKLRRLNS